MIAVLFAVLFCGISVVVPWVGVVLYYMVAVGQPGGMWPEHFGDSRLSLYMSAAVLIGLCVATATRQVDYRRLVAFPNLLMFGLVVVINLSYSTTAFSEYFAILRSVFTPEEIVETFNKIMVMYFVATLLIDTRFKLIVLLTALGGVLMYYALWANKIYITGEFWRFGDNGRLNGPEGLYHDENYLAMIVLLVTPIFYYLAVGTSNRVIKVGLWLAIPLSWHALFLTGSRGALLALAVVSLYIFFRSYNKYASVVLLVGLTVAIADQSGNMLSRIDSTVKTHELEQERAFIENDDSADFTEKALDPRLISWKVGLNIMKDYPALGVGPGNFMRAFSDYDDTKPHVAHNTFLQITAGGGLFAGFVYLFFLFARIKNVFKKSDPDKIYPNNLHRDYLDDLINSLLIAFYTVALFLDMMVFELLYLLILAGFCKYCLDRPRKEPRFGFIKSIYGDNDQSEEKPQSESPVQVGHAQSDHIHAGHLQAEHLHAEHLHAGHMQADHGQPGKI